MFFSVVLSYLPYALVTSFTPGPNNILAFHTVGQKGWVQGGPPGRDCRRLFFRDGGLRAGLLPAGAAAPRADPGAPPSPGPYLFWLALHLLRSTPAKDVSPPVYLFERIFSPVCQRENYSVRHHHLYRLRPARRQRRPVPPYSPFVLTLFGTAGFHLGSGRRAAAVLLRRHTRAFNGAMAAVLALCALDLLF